MFGQEFDSPHLHLFKARKRLFYGLFVFQTFHKTVFIPEDHELTAKDLDRADRIF